MSLLDSFTGKSQKKFAQQAYANSTRELKAGFDEGRGYAEDYYNKGQGYLQPYAQQGQQASELYGRHIGTYGQDARRNALAEYAGGDPFRQHNQDQTTRAMGRRFNAMGALNSGRADYATSRALMDRGSQDYEAYLNRLAGMQGQGAQMAGQQAGYANQLGQYLGNARMNLGQQQAGNEIQYANALSQAAGILPANLIKVGGMILSAATGMPIGMGGGGGGGGSGMGQNFFSPSQMKSMNGYF